MAFINERSAQFYTVSGFAGKLIVTSMDQDIIESMFDEYKYKCKFKGHEPTLYGFKEYVDEQNIYNCYLRLLNVTNLNM